MQIEYFTVSVLLYLVACAVHCEKPDESKLYGIDISLLYHISQKQSLSAIVYMALENTDIINNADQSIVALWRESKEKSIRNSLLMDAERSKICEELKREHIWYLPLKGCFIKSLYLKVGMREMADNDILFDKKYQKTVRNIFKANGYAVTSYGRGNHDVYRKAPIYNFEMHTALFDNRGYPKLACYYGSIREKLIPHKDNEFSCYLKNEDLYIYVMAHAYKHYSNVGTDIRAIVDCYVLNRNFQEKMDWTYVIKQLEMLGIAEFEYTCRNLANRLFGKTELNDILSFPVDEQKLLFGIIDSGIYSSAENRINNYIKSYERDGQLKWGSPKFKYYMYRLFPGREWCNGRYPFFYRFPVFLPVLWIYRMIQAITVHRKNIICEIKAIQNSEIIR